MTALEMSDGATEIAQQDESAVVAVKHGDAERFRELVERHERRVYAVAWSRLGDAALAEEVTQEAFIRAYHRLWLLGDGAKFAGWINTIARRLAINFGISHRRELNKRERWAIENPEVSSAPDSTDEPDLLYTPETLRQTLAELPAAHRECLVLFYLEGKSGAEAAAVLGITEAALRVRLHRARAVMRERLEQKLEGSLSKLRPAKSLVPAVMAGVMASSSAKAATAGGVGTVLAGALAKIGVAKWLLPFASFFSFLFFLPMLFTTWLFARMELKNFRDQKGFRARLFRAGINRRIFVGLSVTVLVILVSRLVRPYWSAIPNGYSTFTSHPVFLILSLFLFAFLPACVRRMAINRTPSFIVQTCCSLIMGIGFALVGFSLAPVSMITFLVAAQSVVMLPFFNQRPIRMDYNLFLRATEGLLENIDPQSALAQTLTRKSKSELLLFARFLSKLNLVNNHRWVEGGLQLNLPPTGSLPWWGFTDWLYDGPWQRRSRIQLGWDGTVSAHFSESDRSALASFRKGATLPKPDLEAQVAAAVATAWRHQRESNQSAAEVALGQRPENEVFVTPPARGGVAKVRWLLAGLMVLVMVMFSGFRIPGCRERLDGLKPVSISEREVRAFINDTAKEPDQKNSKPNSPATALFTCLVLPSTNLFAPEGLRMMRDEVVGGEGFDSLKGHQPHSLAVFHLPLLRYAVAEGWIDWSDLAITPSEAATALRASPFPMYSPQTWDHLLTRCEAWSCVKSERSNVMRIQSDGVNQLRLLRSVNSLDLTDRDKLIAQIASVQTLSGTPPGQPPIHDWRDVRGLFFTPNWPALQDTYFALAALEILGGLDKIDREACIKGILKRHEGRGFFTSPDSGGWNEYHIDGSARDTIAAFESLRILGALDRVKDLEKWQFRPQRRGLAKGELRWGDIEAWVCEQRLQRILQEHKQNPHEAIRSLQDP